MAHKRGSGELSVTMSVFQTKKQVKAFVCEQSVANKKPFCVTKSDHIRYVVVCPTEGC